MSESKILDDSIWKYFHLNDHLQQLHDVESHQDCEKKSQEILAKNSVF